MKIRWWKKDKCDCDLTKKVDLLRKELKIQEKETELYHYKYNQAKERNLLLDSESDFI